MPYLDQIPKILGALALVVAATAPARAAEPVDTELPKYNVTWTAPSAAITDSLPIGNGRVAALVRAESNGDLRISLATGDSWDENARSIRLGNLRVAVTPNPFAAGKPFTQVLRYKEGEITINAGSPAVAFRVWVDANNPVVHVEATSASAFNMTVTPELWRTTRQDVSNNLAWKDFIHVAKDVSSNTSLLSVVLMPDAAVTGLAGKVGWYHHNATSHWGETMTNQSIDVTTFGVKDPLTNRTSGALVQGTGMTPSGNTLASSQAQTSFRVDIATDTKITPDIGAWQSEIDALATTVFAANIETLRTAHQRYWSDLWNRSYLFVTGDTDADNVTKGWLAARYLEACQGRAESPIEFNGGLFTFQNDVKLWHDYTQANQQFAHWGMLPSGDFDLIQSWFDMNVAAIPVSRAKSKAMWKHDGVMLPEHWVLYGPQSGSHYGWDRTGRDPSYELAVATRLLYGGTVETAALMLDYYEYTGDPAFVTNKLLPFVGQVVKWYDLHWPRVGGKINMSPIYSGEEDKNVTNSMVDVAGLTKIVNGLLALPTTLTTQTDRDYWTSIKGQLPALPISGGRMRPAQNLAVGADTNNQNLEPIFPFRLYGAGLPDLQTAVDSYNNRTGQAPRDGRQAWRHDAPHAAYLGLANEAKTQTVLAFTNYNYKYVGFVKGSPDADSCIEPIAIGKIALQAMVMHPGAGTKVNLLNAWPAGWSVQFKLWAPQRTWVAAQYTGGKFTGVTVSPAARAADILINGAAPTGTTITGSDDAGGFINGATSSAGGSGPVTTGSAGATGAGTGGTGGVSTGGAGSGTAGTSGPGTAGTSGPGTAGTSGPGTAGTTGGGAAGISGTAGGGATTSTGTAGSTSTGTGGTAGPAPAPSAGCGCSLALVSSGPSNAAAGGYGLLLAIALGLSRRSARRRGRAKVTDD